MSEPVPDLFRTADYLVRFSGVPLPAIASSLGFTELAGFSTWFEKQSGEHPESARFGPAPGVDEPDLLHLRQALAQVLTPSATAPMIRALRHRRPMATKPGATKSGATKPGADDD